MKKERWWLKKERWWWAMGFGLVTILMRLPFLFRYDLYFQSDTAIQHLLCKRMLVREFVLYHWGGDYIGMGPVDFITAGLFAVFGASVPLSGFVSLLFWGLGVGALIWYVRSVLGRSATVCAGIALSVGVPFFLLYNTQPYGTNYNMIPLVIGAFFLLALHWLKTGPRVGLAAVTGFVTGWCWYAQKQALAIWASVFLGFCLFPAGRSFLKQFMRSWCPWVGAIAFLIGYSPELAYRFGLVGNEYGFQRGSESSHFFSLASPSVLAQNWFTLFRCIPTYFNADPWSRAPEDVHYLNHLENWESFPSSAVDVLGIVAAFLTLSFMLQELVRNYRQQRIELFLLAVCPLVNAAIVLTAGFSDGSYYNIRRYILPAGVLMVLWLGLRLAKDIELRRWIPAGWLCLMLGFSLYDQYAMLRLPDGLVDYRATVRDLEQHGYRYGLTWYSLAHTLTALSNERVQFGIVDRKFQSPYQTPALAQNEIAVVWQAVNPPAFAQAQRMFFGPRLVLNSTTNSLTEILNVNNVQYRCSGPARLNGELAWAPYRKVYPR